VADLYPRTLGSSGTSGSAFPVPLTLAPEGTLYLDEINLCSVHVSC
jgi:hypothetical protein